jgi:RNA polymerase sigma factor (sigma-70 family)
MTSRAEDPSRWITDALGRYERPLVGYVRRLLGDLDVARDVVQEAFLRLCRTDSPPPTERLAPWLYRVCRNLAIDHLRKEGRMHALEQTERLVDPDTQQTLGDGTPSLATAQGRAEHIEESGRLAALVAELPARQQEVVRLRFQDALTYREMATVTGASVSHVGVLLHAAMSTLRRRMVNVARPTACERSPS